MAEVLFRPNSSFTAIWAELPNGSFADPSSATFRETLGCDGCEFADCHVGTKYRYIDVMETPTAGALCVPACGAHLYAKLPGR